MLSHDQTLHALQQDIIHHHAPASTPSQYISLLPDNADRGILASIVEASAQSKLAEWTAAAKTPPRTMLSAHMNNRVSLLNTNKCILEEEIGTILTSLSEYKQRVASAVHNADTLFTTHAPQHDEYHRLFQRYYTLVLDNSRLKLELVWYGVQEDIYDGDLDGPRMIRFV
jgi:hypothetical protein